MTYGSGHFCNGEIWIQNAFEPGYAEWFKEGLERVQTFHDSFDMPYPAFPRLPGAIRLGGDGLGNELFYLVRPGKKAWSVVTMQHESEEDAETHKLPLTRFLAKVFSRELECNIWHGENYFGDDAVLDFKPRPKT